MQLSYYRRRGEQNGRADARYFNSLLRRSDVVDGGELRKRREWRLDNLSCEMYSAEFDVYIASYRNGWDSVGGESRRWMYLL